MSGGSLNYGDSKIRDIVYDMGKCELTPKMRVFRAFLEKVAIAVHDVEWELSSDYGPGDSDAAIDACIPKGFALSVAIDEAREAEKNLRVAIAAAEKESDHE